MDIGHLCTEIAPWLQPSETLSRLSAQEIMNVILIQMFTFGNVLCVVEWCLWLMAAEIEYEV